MQTTNLVMLIESALQKMEQDGASAHMLKNYRETGFGVFRRHFRRCGQTEYSDDVIDEIVAKTRSVYENGEIGYGKWKLVHRGGELLKLFNSCGSLDLPPCERWDVTHNKLHCEPSIEERNDINNIFSLVWRVKQALSESNLSAKTQSHYQYDGFDRILKIHIEYKSERYSSALLAELVEQSRQDGLQGKMNASVFNSLRRAVNLLREFHETGELRSIMVKKFDVRESLGNINDLNMRELMELALQKMELNDNSEKTLKDYRTSGFGSIVRHCELIGQRDYSAVVIDTFVSDIRTQYEQSKVSRYKWTLIRRSGELFKRLHDNGTIDLPPCKSWEALHNPLHRQPTEEELANPNSVVALARRTEQMLTELGLTPKTLSNYRYDGFDRILRGHYELGLTDYSPDLAEEVVKEARAAYESGKMARSVYQDIRKVADILTKVHESGTYDPKYLSRYGLRQLSDTYDTLLENFCVYTRRTVVVKESTVGQAKSSIRCFLFELEDAGFMSLDSVTRRIISERITHLAGRYAGGLSAMLFGVRIFLRYLHSNWYTNDDLSIAIPELIAPRKRIQEGFSPDVIEKLLAAADTSTVVGKRDYAIMLLGKQTGLRACDVTNLKRENIDWRQHEIRIVQVKTEVPLTLPLPIESGNAIADYLLNARPKSNSPHIFLSKDQPHRPLKSVGTIIPRYIKKAGIADNAPKRSGFHSFRRSYGKQLLEAETTLDMLSELLGQLNMDSAKPYIAADEQGLKRCALGLVDSGKVGDVL
jgi:site-specific recombinase XerD